MAALLTAVYISGNADTGWSARAIILIAVAPRLIFLFGPPQLSDDIYRYAWDGLTVLNGASPYAVAPADAKPFSAESAAILPLVSHPNLVTIYPPMAQVIFAVGVMLGGVTGIKTCLAVMDIATCAVILRVVSLMKLPRSRAIIYAWSPLPVLEIASSGHIDGAAIFLLLLAFMILIPPDGSRFMAGAVFALSALTKLFPMVFLPIFLILAGEKGLRLFVLGGAVAVIALTLPFSSNIGKMFITLEVYARDWEFSGFVYKSLTQLFLSGSTARLVLAIVFFCIAVGLYHSLYRNAVNLAHAAVAPSALRAAYLVALAFVLLTPTLHPWYALYLTCLLPFVPGAAGLTVTWAVFLSYRVLIPFTLLGTWEEKDAIPSVIFLAAVAAPILVWLAGKALDKNAEAVKSQ